MDRKLEVGGGVAAVATASTAFSWGFVIVKVLGLPAPTLGLWRTLIGAAVLGAAAFLLRVGWPKHVRSVVAAGALFGLHQIAFITATQTTSIAIVTLVGALSPLVVALVSRRTVGEAVPGALFAWALVALAGVAVVVHANLGDPSRSLIGDALSVVNVFVFTAFFLASKRARLEGTHTLTLTAGMNAVSALVLLLAMPFVPSHVPEAGWQWGLLVVLAMGPGNGHLLVNWAHRRISAALASLVLTAVPLLASLWAHLVLGEPYGPRHVAGMLLVAIAVEGGRRAEQAVRNRD